MTKYGIVIFNMDYKIDFDIVMSNDLNDNKYFIKKNIRISNFCILPNSQFYNINAPESRMINTSKVIYEYLLYKT